MTFDLRYKAYEIFRAIVREGGYSNLVISKMLPDNMYHTDRGFVTALVYGTLDKLINIDYIISLYAKGRLQPRVQDVLRLSVYQLLYMDIPDYTVCSEAVRMTNAVGKGALKGYVNGVMRTLAREKDSIAYPDAGQEPARYLSVRYSYPQFLVQEMLAEQPFEQVKSALDIQLETGIPLRCNTDRISADSFFAALEQKKLQPKHGRLFDYVVTVKGNRIFKDDLYTKGFCCAQSEPSVLICNIVAPQRGERILDCCAAPGGKSIFLYQLMGEGEVVACDIHQHRIELIQANAARCGADITAVLADATQYTPALGLFDRVLVDAPCSGLGVVNSKPDIKLTVTPQKLCQIEKLQAQILDNAANYVKPGGLLVYSTCTVRSKENIEQVNAFLMRHTDFATEDCRPYIPQGIAEDNGYVQLLPHINGTEGFFAIRLRRKS